jgi:predicted nucleic acid-binding protein
VDPVIHDRIVIADTNVISYIVKDLPLGREYARRLERFDVHVSFVTAAELRYWPEKNRWGPRRRLELERFLSQYPVIPYRHGMDKRYAEVTVLRERVGRPLSWPDRWIATTAAWHDVTLVTHDGDFDDIPWLRVINASHVAAHDQALTPEWSCMMRPRPSGRLRSECSY